MSAAGAVLGVVAVIMLGLGLSLSVADFRRVNDHRRVVALALACQLLLLPLACFSIVTVLDLPPVLAVGMMLISASPGGPLAAAYSHLFGGDVAFNITLTAVNAVFSVVSLTVITNLSLAHFMPENDSIDLQTGKVLEVFAIILIPLASGMAIRTFAPRFADRADRPVKVIVAIAVVLVTVASIKENYSNLTPGFGKAILAAIIFGLLSLTVGYWVPRLAGGGRPQSIAACFEIGIHNYAIAISIAMGFLDNDEMAVPASIYGLAMVIFGLVGGLLFRRNTPEKTMQDAA